MAKRKKATLSPDDLKLSVAASAMERGAKVLRERLPSNAADIDAGSYPVALTIEITGDIVKGKPETEDDKECPKFSDDELLIALFSGKTAGEVQELVEPAIEAIIRARENAGTAGAIEKAKVLLSDAVKTYAKSRGEWITKAGKTSKGKTTGKPRISIDGTFGFNEVDMSVELVVEANAEKPAKGKGKKRAA